jgi:hypothetical protein
MKITKLLALGTLMALGLFAASACDDAKKDAKVEAKADGKAADVKAPAAKVEAKAADAKLEPATDAKLEPAADAKAEGGAVAAAEPAGEVPKLGVPECDEYIGKMTQCFASGGVPPAESDAQKLGFDMTVKGWVDAVKADPESGSALVTGCKAALDAATLRYPTCFAAK